MKKIIIVGARVDGHAKVVLEILQKQNLYEVIGFIDDNLFGIIPEVRGCPIIGTMSDLPALIKKYNIAGGIVAIGNNPVRRRLAEKIKSLGLLLVNAIHPTVTFDTDVKMGEGNVFCQNVTIVTGTIIGSSVNIHTGATIDHDNHISDGANIGPGVHTAGRVTIGMDAFFGTGSIAIPDAVVGEGAIVGAGAVILKSVEPYTLVAGVPAKFVKKLKKEND